MDTIVSNDWIVLVCLAAFAYVFGVPLIIYKTFRHEASATLKVVTPDVLIDSEIGQQHLVPVQEPLAQAGFEVVETFFMPQPMDNVRSMLVLFVNRRTQESAMAVTMFGLVDEDWYVKSHHVEFTTRFRDGLEINTLNTTEVSAFRTPPDTVTTAIPWITDPLKLHQVHQAISSAKDRVGKRELRIDTKYDGDPSAYLAGAIREELESAAEYGYVRLTEDGMHYVATLKGAYLMTWKQLPPFKWFYVRNRHRSTKQFLATLDLGN